MTKGQEKTNQIAKVQPDSIDAIATTVMKSSIYKDAFKTKEDVIATLTLGQELGLDPHIAVQLHKELNRNTIFAVMTGRSIGIDPITAIRHIHPIPSGKGMTYVTDIHIITAQLNKLNVDINIIEDAKPLYLFKNVEQVYIKEEDIEANPDEFEIIPIHRMIAVAEYLETGKETPLAKGIDLNKNMVVRTTNIYNKRTTVELTRTYPTGEVRKVKTSYTLEQARVAQLLKSVNDKGQIIHKGKDNWNNHPETMLRNRTIAISGRIIASDHLNGLYVHGEIIDNRPTVEPKPEIKIEEAHVVEEAIETIEEVKEESNQD